MKETGWENGRAKVKRYEYVRGLIGIGMKRRCNEGKLVN